MLKSLPFSYIVKTKVLSPCDDLYPLPWPPQFSEFCSHSPPQSCHSSLCDLFSILWINRPSTLWPGHLFFVFSALFPANHMAPLTCPALDPSSNVTLHERPPLTYLKLHRTPPPRPPQLTPAFLILFLCYLLWYLSPFYTLYIWLFCLCSSPLI